MSKEYEVDIYGHPSILSPTKDRKLNIYFSEPELGVTTETGIVLFISGFGGNSNSNVYKKMRREFSDKYNLITIQCDYFGWEFMQATDLKTNKETLENYNDMGLIQAIDNISAVLYVIEILKDNKCEFDENKIILYGQSHGAYLSYLCNALAPSLFSLLIDNSSWLFPQYLKNNRYLYDNLGNTTIFNYLASNLEYDEEILSLNSLYKKFCNDCDVICYHGTNDNLISHKDKKKLKNIMHKFYYNEISERNIDNKIFKSTKHGLNADFLELFNYTIKNHKFKKTRKSNYADSTIIYETEKYIYLIEYKDIIPKMKVTNKN